MHCVPPFLGLTGEAESGTVLGGFPLRSRIVVPPTKMHVATCAPVCGVLGVAQDALLALRESVVHRFDVKEDGDNLILMSPGGAPVAFPKTTKTAFKKGNTLGHYTLFALWLQWVNKDKPIMEMWAECEKRGLTKVNAVLVNDKKPLIAYLSGQDDGAQYIDRDVTGGVAGVALAPAASARATAGVVDSAGPAGAPTGSSLVGAALDTVVAESLRAAGVAEVIRLERSLRTRTTILDAPGAVDLRELVFKCFGGREEGAAGAGAGVGVGPQGAGAGASSGAKKRGRDSVGGPAGGGVGAAAPRPSECLGLPHLGALGVCVCVGGGRPRGLVRRTVPWWVLCGAVWHGAERGECGCG